MSIRKFLKLVKNKAVFYVPWLSDDTFEGVALVKVKQDYDDIYEIDHTGDTNPTEFGLPASKDDVHVDIKTIVFNIFNGGGQPATCLLEYWNGTGWNKILKCKVVSGASNAFTVAVTGHFDTGARNEGEKFFRVTNSASGLEAYVTILGHEEE